MKMDTISIQISHQRRKAIQFYAGRKESSLEAELDDFIQKMYEKYVPTQTREYIESIAEQEEGPPRQRSERTGKRTVVSKEDTGDDQQSDTPLNQ